MVGRHIDYLFEIWFNYAVQAGDADHDGISILADALSVFGGAVVDAHDDSGLDLGWLAIDDSRAHRVDGRAPLRPSVDAGVRSPFLGGEVGASLYFTEPVTVALGPQLAGLGGAALGEAIAAGRPGVPLAELLIGNRRVTVPINSWNWRDSGDAANPETAATLSFFPYRLEAGDFDDGIEFLGVSLNGATIRDSRGVDVDLDVGHLDTHFPSETVDARINLDPPVVTSVSISGQRMRRANPAAPEAYTSRNGRGDLILVEVQFDRPIDWGRAKGLRLALALGDRRVEMLAVRPGGPFDHLFGTIPCTGQSSACQFAYEVRAGDREADGLVIPSGTLPITGGPIVGVNGGAEAVLEWDGTARAAITVDTSRHSPRAPRLTSLDWSAHSGEFSAYSVGDTIPFTVLFDKPVEVTGSPRLALDVGNRRVAADYLGVYTLLSTGFRSQLCFQYIVQAEDRDPDGVSIPPDALSLNGGAIRNPAGKDAVILSLKGWQSAREVDGSVTAHAEVSETSVWEGEERASVFHPGDEIVLYVRWTSGVQVTGSPRLALEIGDRRVQAELLGHADFGRSGYGRGIYRRFEDGDFLFGPGLQGTLSSFRYVVQAGDRDEDGVALPANALSLNGGTIRGRGGDAARLESGARTFRNVKVDGGAAP